MILTDEQKSELADYIIDEFKRNNIAVEHVVDKVWKNHSSIAAESPSAIDAVWDGLDSFVEDNDGDFTVDDITDDYNEEDLFFIAYDKMFDL